MRRIILPAVLLLGASADADPARLSWLEGRWTGTQGGVRSEEIWSSPEGGALLGMHKDLKGGRAVSWEFMRIAMDGDRLVFFGSPRSAPPTPFAAVEVGPRRVVFAKPDHDFPQRVIYWLDERGALRARVEGTLKGKPAAEEWTWTRESAR
jgi:hypothetical protein